MSAMSIDQFVKEHCLMCGTQRCMGARYPEFANECSNYQKYVLENAEFKSSEDIAEEIYKVFKENSKVKPKQETSGHLLNVGDRVKMNIAVIGEGDMDGVEFTSTGKNYWRHMNQFPDEIYTITSLDFTNDEETSYNLSGYMSDNNWYSSELILIPQPKTLFECIKCATLEEMQYFLEAFMTSPLDVRIIRDLLDTELPKEIIERYFPKKE